MLYLAKFEKAVNRFFFRFNESQQDKFFTKINLQTCQTQSDFHWSSRNYKKRIDFINEQIEHKLLI